MADVGQAKYRPYPAYKSSGVEWLGVIPEGWRTAPIKQVAKIENGATPKSSEASFWDGSVPWVTPADLGKSSLPYLGIGNRNISEKGFASCGASMVPKGSVILSSRAPIGALGISERALSTNQGCKSLVPFANICAKYLYHFLSINSVALNMLGRGSTFLELSSSDLGSFKTSLPPLPEQTKIAAFLDHETAKTDALIAKQQRLIALLEEKRQAVISHAVTKGLDPTAPLRPSGIDWLGDVPEHWEVKKLKHISPKVGVGLVINPSTYTCDEGRYFIFGGDVKEFAFDLRNTRRISASDSEKLTPSLLKQGDLLSIRVGFPGVTAVAPEELEGANCASVIITRKGDFNSHWLCAAMNSWVGKKQVELVSYGAAQKQYNVSDAIDFLFPMPDRSEQNEIANFIDDARRRFDELASKAQSAITLLKERRAALISAAVTGKIDLRDWQPPASATARTADISKDEFA